ncbi:MAG: carbohydrate porin [Candidatus Omnitrophota bacterium]
MLTVIFRKTILLVICFCLMNGVSFAEETSIKEEINQLKARIQALEDKVANHEKCIYDQNKCILDQNKKIAEYESQLAKFDTVLHRQVGAPISIGEGLEISVGGTMIAQGATNVNNAASDVEKKASRTDASYSADITLGKEFEDIGGKAFLHLEAGNGEGLNDDLTLYSAVNNDADNEQNVHLTELWYEQALFKDRVVLTFGKLDPTIYFDNNDIANDETTQFLSSMLVNSPTIEFPGYAAGIRLAYMPVEWLELGYGVLDGNSDWEKIGDNLFNIGQVTFKTKFFQLPGNYRILGWNSNVYHTKWLDTERTKEANYGFGLSFDQKLNDSITLFCRYGWQDPEVYNPDTMATGDLNYSLEQSWSAGLQIEGKPWGRENDVFGFAVGQVIPSNDYKKADETRNARNEGHIETYYRIYVNKHLSVSPDFQYIWNPFGGDIADDPDNIFIGGMRAQVDF